MTYNVLKTANGVADLTYSEMKEMAERLVALFQDDGFICTWEQIAENLICWAQAAIDEDEEAKATK